MKHFSSWEVMAVKQHTHTPTAPQTTEEPTMSQTTDLFIETNRMSNEPLEYFGEPIDSTQNQSKLTPELDRIFGEQSVDKQGQEPEGEAQL